MFCIVGRYTDSSIPNPNPTNFGSALAVAKAYNTWVHAVHEFNLLRRTIGPINMELRAKMVSFLGQERHCRELTRG